MLDLKYKLKHHNYLIKWINPIIILKILRTPRVHEFKIESQKNE